MPDTATHPTDAVIEAFALGKSDSSGNFPVEEHLATCDRCQDRAAAVAGDTLVELLASARTRFDSNRAIAATPTLDGIATPALGAATLAWDSSTGLADAEVPAALAGLSKYRVVRRLGTGGMGTVWLAEHAVMNRPVAIKVIRPDLLARPGAAGRFLREVRAAAKLHHPHIVTAFDAEQAGDSCLLVMEYVPGETLGERLANGPFPVAEACRAVRDAARGLAHAHAAGLVHRDVKPHNLIRGTDGTVKVLDFGLAGVGAGEMIAAGDGLTGAGMVVGTPHYIAPEQVADPHTADARADIYGLGCTLYHLLAGDVPFPDGSIAETLKAHQTREPGGIPGLAPAVAAVLAKMLAKRPEDRYQTADDVVVELDRILATAEPGIPKKVIRRAIAWAAVAAAFSLATAAAVVIKIYRDNQEITVKTDDDAIEVVMKRNGEVLRVVDKKTNQAWEIDTTTNQIAQADRPDGLTISLPEKEPFVLRRNGKDVFTVTRLLGKGDAPPIAGGRPPTGPSPAEVGKFTRLDGPVFQAVVSRDGSSAFVVNNLGTAKYRVATGERLWATDPSAGGEHLAVPADERFALVWADDGTGRILDPASGQVVRSFKGADKILGSALARDGTRAVTGHGDVTRPDAAHAIRVWDVAAGKELFRLTGHTGPTAGLAFSPDGKRIATASYDGWIRLWEADTGKEVQEFTAEGTVLSVTFTPDGAKLVTCGEDSTVRVWDTATGKMAMRMPGHNVLANQVAVTPDGTRAISAGWGAMNGGDGLRVWDLGTGQLLHHFPDVRGIVYSIAATPDSTRVVTAGDDGFVRVWRLPDAATPAPALGKAAPVPPGQVRKFGRFQGGITRLVLGTNRRAYATDGKGAAAWDWQTGTELWATDRPGPAMALAAGHNGLAVGGDDGFVRLLKPADGAERTAFRAHPGRLTAVALSPDSSHVAVAGGGNKPAVRIWDVAAGKDRVELRGHTGEVWGLDWSPDGKAVLSAGNDGTVRLWDPATGKEGHTFRGHRGRVLWVAFSPDSRTAASGGEDMTVRLWDLVGKQALGVLEGHDAWVGEVAFTPDGRRLVSVSGIDRRGDGLRVWDVGTRTLLYHAADHRGPLHTVVVSPDGAHAIAGAEDGSIRVFRLPDAPAGKQ